MPSSYLKKCLFFSVLFAMPCHAIDKVSLEESTGLFTATDKTLPLVTAKYVGWEANWKWAGPEFKRLTNIVKKSPTFAYSGEVRALDMGFSTTAKLGHGQIVWNYDWHNKQNHPNAIGFGMQFNVQLDSPTFEKPAQAPELLADNKGWRWQTPNGKTIEVTFSPALAKLYFERNQKNVIRAMFFSPVSKGNQKTTMTVKVSDNVALAGLPSTSDEKSDRQEGWRQNILSEKVSPVDLSFLNQGELPAGRHGFVKAKADKLVFQDGTPAKFWGTNIMAYALFSSSDVEIKTHAKRIAQLGFNLARIHHHDSYWVKNNIFKNQEDNTHELSPEAFKKLDWWIHCLKEQGVYVWLDLHVGRAVTKRDGIENFDEINRGKNSAELKGFNYYNGSVQQQMQKFNEAYVSHVNSFTKLAYKDDPAVIALLLTNENDLTQHYGHLFLPDKGLPKSNAIFTEDLKKFSQTSGLSSDRVGRTWEMGESKIYLADVEHRFNQKMIAHLRGLDAKSMIATTNSWGNMGLFGLPSLTEGDIIDTHSYGRVGEFSYNPRYNPGYLAWVGAGQVTGKPLAVSEWNVEKFPVEDRFTAPIYMAGIASLQGWDAMMFYGYCQHSLNSMINGDNYTTYNDPAITGLMPAAALIYRQGQVSPAKRSYELKLSRDDFFFKLQDPTTSKSIRTLLETSRFTVTIPDTKELPWLNHQQEGGKATVITDANQDFIPAGQNFIQSDTGELKRDWEKGLHIINSPKSQVVSGLVGGAMHKLKDVSFKLNTKKAVVAVQSLDNKDISKSKHIFITAMARSAPTGNSNSPFSTEPVTGLIELSAPAGLSVYPINPFGKREKPIKAMYAKGKYVVELDWHNQNHWYELVAN